MRVRGEYIVGTEFDRLDNILLSFTPPSIPITPPVTTDFEDGTPDGWHFLNTGGISIESSGGNPGKCCRIFDSGNGRSYAIDVDMLSSDNDNIGIMFNYQDNQNTYIFIWNRQGNWRSIVKVENGAESSLISDNVPYSEDVWYHINILFIDGHIDINIDGNQVFSVYDTNYISGGKAGLYARYNSPSYWDNFEVINNNSYKYLDLQVFLEGPFSGSDMNTGLNSSGNIPLSQPYNVPPCNYAGTESGGVYTYDFTFTSNFESF